MANPRTRPDDSQRLKGYRESYGLIVICKDEEEQKRLYDVLTGMGLHPRVVVT